MTLLALLGSVPLGAGEIRLAEVAHEWGLVFRYHHGGRGDFYMPESMGSGVVIIDYDGDGDEDVFFVDSGSPAPYNGEPARPRLYRNEGGSFLDVTERSGMRIESYGMGVTAGDVDGDGDPDLYLTAFGPNQLLLNNGDGTFRDVTRVAGVGDPSWGMSAAFADVDLDSDLDLYVTNYVDFSYDNNEICGLEAQGLRSYCHPNVYRGLADRFYRNRGNGTFGDATVEAGFGAADGNGLGVVFGDLDGDGWPDLYVANDMTPNFHFRNQGDGTFEDVALMVGTALSDMGEPEAGMGVGMGDLDGDGRPDLMMTHLDRQTNAVYANTGAGIFLDRRFAWRLAEPSVAYVGFGIAFVDLDLDGDLDVAVANGHIIHNIEAWNRGGTYRQRTQIFANSGGGLFEEVHASGVDVVRPSRGLAVGDLDGDGDVDLVISNREDEAEVYENRSEEKGGWLKVDLFDPGRGNRYGIGARLELETGSGRQVREVRTASSYLSQSATSVVFGVGQAEQIDRLHIRWPGGPPQTILSLPANRRVRVVRK